MRENSNKLFWYIIFCTCCLPISQLCAQGVIATDGGLVTITFDGSTPGILNGSFDATDISANPAPGDLDSDGVNFNKKIPGTADVPAVFGTNNVSFKGANPGNVSEAVGGVWAFDVQSGSGVNRTLGFQPNSNEWGGKDDDDGQVVFKFVNNSGVTLTAFRVQYKLYQAIAPKQTVIESYLTTNVATPNYGTVRSSHATPVTTSFSFQWQLGASVDYSVTSGVNVPNGGAIYLRFYIFDGPQTASTGIVYRPEIAIDDIKILGASNPTTLLDCFPPEAICKNATVNLNSAGNGTLAVSSVNSGSTTECGLASLALSRTSFNCSNIGSNTVTLTVTDEKGQTGTCSSTVTVADNINPTASCRNATVQLDDTGNGSISASAINNGSSDVCG